MKYLHQKISKLFLYTRFSNPNFIRGAIAKHLEIPNENVVLGTPKETETDLTMPLLINVDDTKYEFILTFIKHKEEQREIEVPKVVKRGRKWWHIRGSNTEVIVEKKKAPSQTYWLLNSIS